MIASWQESYDKPRQCIEKQSHYFVNEDPNNQGYGLPSGHVQLWELNHKEGKAPKNWCLQIVVPEKTPESLLDSKEIKPVNLKGNQPWLLIGKADDKAEAPVFWSSDVNSWLTGKVPDAGKDWGQKKRVSEDEMAGWHHGCNGHEFGQTLGDDEGQGGLECWSQRGCKGLDTPGHLNNCSKSRECVLNHFWTNSIFMSLLWATSMLAGHLSLLLYQQPYLCTLFR